MSFVSCVQGAKSAGAREKLLGSSGWEVHSGKCAKKKKVLLTKLKEGESSFLSQVQYPYLDPAAEGRSPRGGPRCYKKSGGSSRGSTSLIYMHSMRVRTPFHGRKLSTVYSNTHWKTPPKITPRTSRPTPPSPNSLAPPLLRMDMRSSSSRLRLRGCMYDTKFSEISLSDT